MQYTRKNIYLAKKKGSNGGIEDQRRNKTCRN